MTDIKYNGWNNYQTWLCKLWMDNDQGLHELQNEWASTALDDSDNDKEDARSKLADMIEAFWDELAEEKKQSGFFADLMNHGLGMVDWYEIAENILHDFEENKV